MLRGLLQESPTGCPRPAVPARLPYFWRASVKLISPTGSPPA